MRTRLAFQYLAPGSKQPDDTTLAEVFAELRGEDHVPNIGDIITMLPKPPSEGRTHFRRLKVVARNFWYSYGSSQLDELVEDELVDCQIYLILSQPDDDDIIDFAE